MNYIFKRTKTTKRRREQSQTQGSRAKHHQAEPRADKEHRSQQ